MKYNRLIDTVPIPGSTFVFLNANCECGNSTFRSEGQYNIFCVKCNNLLPVRDWDAEKHRHTHWYYDPVPPEATNI